MSISKEDAWELAVRYEAWCAAMRAPDCESRDHSILTWGILLSQIMDRTGVKLRPPGHIASEMTFAKNRIQARKAEEAQ